MSEYKIIIGLEIHAELDTDTKAFCSCRNVFGALPNTQVCPVCLGLPGSLPMLNRKAIEYTIMGGLSFGSEISNHVVFERKNYFCADLPKSYQITQLSEPICRGGGISLDNGKLIKFNRIHLEEDTAKSIHNNDETLIDFNRAGVPIIELVTEPTECTADEVVEFLSKLRKTLIYSGVARCKIEEGGIRFDMSISVMPIDSDVLGTRCEINNLASPKSVEDAIVYESQRQISLIESGQTIVRETRGWNEETKETYSIREKESELDYRYFPDPDIMPLEITERDVKRLKTRLPEIIDNREQKLLSLGLRSVDVELLLGNKELLDYYMEVIEHDVDPIESMNWIMNDLLREKKGNPNITFKQLISCDNFAKVINALTTNRLTRVNAKILFDEIISTSKDAEKLIIELDLEGEVNRKDIIDLIELVIKNNPEIIDDYLSDPDEVINYFIGNIMVNTQGKAKIDSLPAVIEKTLNKYIKQ